MTWQSRRRSIALWLGAGTGLVAGAYTAYVAATWSRYGLVPRRDEDDDDPLLDRFIPEYEVEERHHVHVAAPAAVTLQAARQVDLTQSRLVRAIFRAREVMLGARRDDRPQPKGLLAQVQSLGWSILAEVRDREIVVGAVTKPWEPNVTFRSIAPEMFQQFAEPDYVKIAWTLGADPLGDGTSVFRTETRAIATDPAARAKFRRYWALVSPGIILIRRMSLCAVKADAERRLQVRQAVTHDNARGLVTATSAVDGGVK